MRSCPPSSTCPRPSSASAHLWTCSESRSTTPPSSPGCGYCTLHTCFFALARGVPRSCILGPKNVDDLPPKTRAVARLAVGLASVPAQVRNIACLQTLLCDLL